MAKKCVNDAHPPATPATPATQDALPSEGEIRAVLEIVASNAPCFAGEGPLVSGWYWLAALGFDGGLTDDNVGRLLSQAKGMQGGPDWTFAPDPYAFDAACFAGARMLRAGADLPPPLRDFLAGVLAREITRTPPKGKRRRTEAADLDRTALALALVHMGWLHLGENTASMATAKPKRLSASRAVADAFTAAGCNTTKGRVKDLCVNAAYETLRQAIAAGGWVERADAMLRQSLRHVRARDTPPTV